MKAQILYTIVCDRCGTSRSGRMSYGDPGYDFMNLWSLFIPEGWIHIIMDDTLVCEECIKNDAEHNKGVWVA